MPERDDTPRRRASVTFVPQPDALREVSDELVGAIQAAGYPDASVFALRLVLEEAVANAHKHGNQGSDDLTIDVAWIVEGHEITISVEDQGTGFQPEAVPDPRSEERLELPSGRGLLLMRSYMTDVRFNERGNRVTMVYRRPEPA